MKLVTKCGLAGLAALSIMAFIGASSASATFNTQLCATSSGLTCGTPAKNPVHATLRLAPLTLLSDSIDVLCLNVLLNGEALSLANPQVIHGTVSLTNCGSNSAHDNCTATVEEQPLFHLLKTATGRGFLLGLSGLERVKCTVFGFIKIDCLYDYTGIELSAEDPGLLKLEETPVAFVEGSGLCPEESSIDGELETLTATYIRS